MEKTRRARSSLLEARNLHGNVSSRIPCTAYIGNREVDYLDCIPGKGTRVAARLDRSMIQRMQTESRAYRVNAHGNSVAWRQKQMPMLPASRIIDPCTI